MANQNPWYSPSISYGGGTYQVECFYKTNGNTIVCDVMINVISKATKRIPVFIRWGSGSLSEQKNIIINTSDLMRGTTASVNGNSIIVKVEFGTGADKQVTEPPTYYSDSPCPGPSDVKSKRITNTHHEITINANCLGYNVTSYVIERKDDNGSFSTLETVPVSWTIDGISEVYHDYTTTEDHEYTWRVKLQTIDGDSDWVTSNSQRTQPETHEGITVEQHTGTLSRSTYNKIKWTKSTTPSTTAGWLVQYEANGSGRWITFALVVKSSLVYNYFALHYPQKGKTYRYRLLAYADTGHDLQDIPIIGKALDEIPLLGDLPLLQIATTAGQASESLITEPTAPALVSAHRGQDGASVVVNITDVITNTAENVQIMRSGDGGAWVEVATIPFEASNSWTDEEAGGFEQIQYKVRNSNEVGFSSYKNSNVVEMLSTPDAPYIDEPYNGVKQMIEDGSVDLKWRHRPTDGTPQTAAQLQWRRNNGEWNTETLTTESVFTFGFAGLDANDVISWRVRTKGYYADWSDYSVTYSFTLLRKPQIQITSPVLMAVETLPITVAWNYVDESGEIEKLTLSILSDGDVVAKYSLSGIEQEYIIKDFLFENHRSYELRLVALSTSGLSSTNGVNVNISYSPTSDEGALIPSFYGDPETGYVNIVVLQETEGTPKNIVEAYMYRVHRKERTLVGEVSNGTQLLDKLSPLNVDYAYELLMLTDEGEIILTRYEYRLNSPYSFVYYGDEIFKGKWNPTFDVSFDRPERKNIYYTGRRLPVSHDSEAFEESCRYSTVITEREEYEKLEDLMRYHGNGIWKSADGNTYPACFKVDVNTNIYDIEQTWKALLSVTRIEE